MTERPLHVDLVIVTRNGGGDKIVRADRDNRAGSVPFCATVTCPHRLPVRRELDIPRTGEPWESGPMADASAHGDDGDPAPSPPP